MATYTEILDLLKKGLTVEAQEEIMEMRESDLQRREEILKLKDEIQQLKVEHDRREMVTWEKPFYWMTKDDGEKDGPLCQVCYDTKNALIVRLQDRGNDQWICRSCTTLFTGENYEKPQRTSRRKGTWMSS